MSCRRCQSLESYYPKTDKAIFDRWSVGHFSVGAIMRLVGLKRPVVYGFSIVFELVENYLKRSIPVFFSEKTTPDTLPHAVVDAALFIAGWEAVNALPPERESYDEATGTWRVQGP